jgi:hypothetical protein
MANRAKSPFNALIPAIDVLVPSAVHGLHRRCGSRARGQAGRRLLIAGTLARIRPCERRPRPGLPAGGPFGNHLGVPYGQEPGPA